MKTYLAAAVVWLVILGHPAHADSSARRVPPPPSSTDYTAVRAVVLDVDRLDFPHVRLELRIAESSNRQVLDLRGGQRTVAAENYLWRTRGRINCLDSRNVGALAAYYLLQGDEIRAKLFSGSSTARRDDEWYIYGIARIGRGFAARRTEGSVIVQDNLELTLEVEEQAYWVGQPVRLILAVKNVGAEPKTLRFSSGQRYDFVVALAGREVWRWSKGKLFTQALTSITLAPGETIRFRETWRQEDDLDRKVQPGEYTVTAILTTMNGPRPTVGPVTVTIRSKE